MPLTHSDVQQIIQSGQPLTTEEQAAVAGHLAACAECRADHAVHSELKRALPRIFPAPHHAPEIIHRKARAAQARIARQSLAQQLALGLRAVAVAGVALAVVLAVLLLPNHLPRLLPGLPPPRTVQPAGSQVTPAGGLTYQDPQGRFILEYPADWSLSGQVESGNGQVLALTAPPAAGQPIAKIEIGIYNQSIDDSEDLAQWIDAYNRRASDFTADQFQTHRREVLQVDGLEAIQVVQTSPLGDYQYTVIRRAREVWFVWSTIGQAAQTSDAAIYQTVLRSLKFAPLTGQATAVVVEPTPTPEPAGEGPFPIDPGTTWIYTKTGYTQAEGDPQKIIQGTTRIEERVAGVQTQSSYTLVHIQGNKSIVSADAGWQENGAFGLGDYEYWFVIQNNQVYLSYTQPDPVQIQLGQMRLLYQFPLQVGSEWCPGSEVKGQPIPDIGSCFSKTIVAAKNPYLSRFGELEPCYEIHDTANSGDVVSQFCKGIGLVAQKYDHAGTRFGSAQELIQFINGKDGSSLTAPTASPTPTPFVPGTPMNNTQDGVVPAVAVQGQTAYIGMGTHLVAIDFHRPAAPQLAAQSPETPANVVKVIALPHGVGPRIAASAGRYLAVFDTSTPTQLSLITQSKLPGPITALILDINTNRIYVGGALEGDASKGFIALLDASGPDTLQQLGTLPLAAPVQSLALAKSTLYAALRGVSPGVIAVPLGNEPLGTPSEAIPALSVSSMTTAGKFLYIGTDSQMLAYDLTDPNQPRFAWQIEHAGDTAIPGAIRGFEIRASAIYIAGLDRAGKPFRLAITPPEPIKASSTVDTASYIAVANGLMLVAGDRLEIYDSRDPQNLILVGSYP
jgi:hypothetical protein